MRQLLLMACLVIGGVGVFVVAAEDNPFGPAAEQDPFAPQPVDPNAIGPGIGPAAVPAGQAWRNGPAKTSDTSSTEQQLQQQLFEAVRSRMNGMSAEELRRLIALVETEEFSVPAAAQEILDSYHAQANAAQAEADQRIRKYRQTAVEDLKELLVRYVDRKQFEEAVAVRNALRAMMVPSAAVQADPGSLVSFVGKKERVLHFRLTGDVAGSVWGTGTYTTDSDLSTAAVHAGVLKSGQTGVVRVTLLPGQNQYPTSTRNGVTSSAWGNYGASYRVSRSNADDLLLPADFVDEPEAATPNDFDDPAAGPTEPEPTPEPAAAPNQPLWVNNSDARGRLIPRTSLGYPRENGNLAQPMISQRMTL